MDMFENYDYIPGTFIPCNSCPPKVDFTNIKRPLEFYNIKRTIRTYAQTSTLSNRIIPYSFMLS